jgi:murein L,D-transpeptidase YafK
VFVLLLVLAVLHGKPAAAQTNAQPVNVKILDEHKDKKGNTVRTVQYELNGRRIVETEIIPPTIGRRVPINPDTMNSDSVLVVVNKSKNNLEIYYRRKLIRAYKAVFGPKPLENKKMAGDRCTPEGWFTIKSKNPQSKYHKFLLINYPNDSTKACFNRLKAKGEIPQNAQPGSDVGIHGIWKGGDDMIELGIGWTDGCIALKNADIDDLYTLVGNGTRVYIRK